MSTKAYIDPVTGATLSYDEARREGAKACMLALAEMIQSAKAFNDGDEKQTNAEAAAHYYDARLRDAKTVADDIGGPRNPYQEGAIIALAEYIHSCLTTGEPNLEVWTPCVALTADQYRDEIAAMAVAMEEESCPA